MAFEAVFDRVECEFDQVESTQQTAVETVFSMENEVEKVLAITANVSEGDVEQAQKTTYNGILSVMIVYVSNGQVFSQEQSVPFQDVSTTKSTDKLSAEMRIVDVDSSLNGSKVKVCAYVEVKLVAKVSQSIKFVGAQSKGVYVKDEHCNYVSEVCAGVANIPYSNCTKTEVDEIVGVYRRCVVNSASARLDSINVDCEIITTVVAKKGSEICSFESTCIVTEEIDARGVGFSDSVKVRCSLIDEKAELIKDKNEFCDSAQLKIEYAVYSENEFNHLVDAFCPQRQMLSTTQACELCCKNSTYYCSDRIDGVQSLAQGDSDCDGIVACVGFEPIIASAVENENKVQVNGILKGTILYRNDESEQLCSLDVSMPFSMALRVPIQDENISVTASVSSLSVKCRRGTDFDVKADVCAMVNLTKTQTVALMTDLVEGDEYEKCDYAFSVYVGQKGENLWEVSRALSCSPDDITAQNNCSFPLCGGERIVVYRKL